MENIYRDVCDCHFRDSLIVSIGNCLTSVFAGFVIFSFLGYLAAEEGKSVDDVVDSGKLPQSKPVLPVPGI